jgi:hypothetical protein
MGWSRCAARWLHKTGIGPARCWAMHDRSWVSQLAAAALWGRSLLIQGHTPYMWQPHPILGWCGDSETWAPASNPGQLCRALPLLGLYCDLTAPLPTVLIPYSPQQAPYTSISSVLPSPGSWGAQSVWSNDPDRPKGRSSSAKKLANILCHIQSANLESWWHAVRVTHTLPLTVWYQNRKDETIFHGTSPLTWAWLAQLLFMALALKQRNTNASWMHWNHLSYPAP